MKNEANCRPRKKRLIDILNKEYFGNKLVVLFSIIVTVVTMVLSLFIKWIKVVNTENLYKSFELKPEVIATLDERYSLLNVLSFVQKTEQGILGLYSMILLLIIIATLYFHLAFLLKVIKNKSKKSILNTYSAAQIATVFSMILCIATIGYIIFTNKQFGMTGFMLSPVVYLILLLSLACFIAIKLVEGKTRQELREYGLKYEFKKNWVLFVMLIPTFIYLLINFYLPMIGVYFAFTSYNFRDGLWASPFIGFKNFEHLFKANLFNLTKNTVVYNLVFIGVGNVLQIAFAIFVSQVTRKRFKRLTQTFMFMPYFVSFVILRVLVYNIFEYKAGMINSYLINFGLDRIDFYNSPKLWPLLITIFYLWKNIGYGMVIYLATILGISGEYYDAAKVDGASMMQQIRYITLPLIKPTFIILLLYALGGIMRGQFELFYQLVGTNGVLYNATDIFDTYVYRITTTQPLNIGIGTAAGLFQSLFGFIVIVVTNYLVKRKNSDYALF